MQLNEQILRTMSSYHAQKSMISLIRLKQKLQWENNAHRVTPLNSDDDDEDHDDDGATILESSTVYDDTPLSPEEADEDQLAEFFTSFEVLLFLEGEEPAQEQADTIAHYTSKRSRSSKRAYSKCSVSYSTDPDDAVRDDDIIEYVPPRKRNRLQSECTNSSTVKE
jgi:hypothetical protein